jgi:hypothetical protein
MNRITVDVETNDKLKKGKLENGFYNIIDAGGNSDGVTAQIDNL